MPQKKALLMLADGFCLEGYTCGADGEATGEVVFTTGMSGYQETLTDPSYYGQIVVFTSAHIGNYGSSRWDNENTEHLNISATGAVFHDLFTAADDATFPHWRAEESLDSKMLKAGFTGICGIDTRALTLHLRMHGAQNGIISSTDLNKESLLARAKQLPSMSGQDFAIKVTCPQKYIYEPEAGEELPIPGNARKPVDKIYNVALIDFGVKRSILQLLWQNGMNPTVWPATSTAEEILASNPDGVMLSNGPGDPAACTYAIETLRKLLGKVPMFGICLGHQILGLAAGAKAYKLPFGHHGLNHPVKDINSGKVSITSQNHGFGINPDTLPANIKPTHWNLNDETLEGMEFTDVPAFSVQYHPEATPGTWDDHSLFGKFYAMIEANK